jgi:hypothetical protein
LFILVKLHYQIVAGMDDPASYPEYVLAIHSSKRLLVEQISPPAYVLADAIISLTLAKGQRHEVCRYSPSEPNPQKIFTFVFRTTFISRMKINKSQFSKGQ